MLNLVRLLSSPLLVCYRPLWVTTPAGGRELPLINQARPQIRATARRREHARRRTCPPNT
jgi:hypothetical protein